MRKLSILSIAAIAAIACGGSSSTPKAVCTAATQSTDCTGGTPYCLEATGGNSCVACITTANCNSFNKVCTANACVAKAATFTQPAGTAAVNFSVDDTANKVYKDNTLPDGGVGPSDLQWKGAMLYDPAHNTITADATWGGPFAALYDDGPWDQGGHEPKGSTAGDHIFGVTVFVTPPASGSGDTYSYGLNDGSIQLTSTVIDPNGWIWPSSTNGSFTVPPAATADVKADGVSLKKFGTTDVQFTVNTSGLAAGAWDTSVVSVKSSAWGWSGIKMGSNAIAMSQITGTGNPIIHAGLANSGDKVQFIVVFNGKEYKDDSGNALVQGITVGTKASGASTYTNATINVACDPSDTATNCTGAVSGIGTGNSYITVP